MVGRIKANAVLDRMAAPHLARSPGRPTKEGDEFALDLGAYRAARWTRAYRLVLVVIDLPDPKTGLRELFPRRFFLVTNWRHEQKDAWSLVEHYRGRGTFEDRLGEFNATIGNGLSAGSFEANETALLLKLLAFNLAGIVRGEMEDATVPRLRDGTSRACRRRCSRPGRAWSSTADGSSWTSPRRLGSCGDISWRAWPAGGAIRRGAARPDLGLGCPRPPTLTSALCCGSDPHDNSAFQAALRPMGVRGWFAPAVRNHPLDNPFSPLTPLHAPIRLIRRGS